MDQATEIEQIRNDATLVHSAVEITAIIARLSAEIEDEIGDKCPVIVPIMMGGAFTAIEICRHFDFGYELDWLHVSRYGRALSGGELRWNSRPKLDLAGRTVLLVDDVLDRGVTLAAVIAELQSLKPASILTAVLVSKNIDDDQGRPTVDFIGTRCPDHYLFGCGMDYKGFWRGLPALYAVAQS